ncbi:hypothetical protein BDK51DRAFT_17199, partial [Blyttiomyces helicus]
LWDAGIKDELQSQKHNGTWKVVPFPPYVKPLNCGWVLKKKLNIDGSGSTLKA